MELYKSLGVRLVARSLYDGETAARFVAHVYVFSRYVIGGKYKGADLEVRLGGAYLRKLPGTVYHHSVFARGEAAGNERILHSGSARFEIFGDFLDLGDVIRPCAELGCERDFIALLQRMDIAEVAVCPAIVVE